MAEEEDGSLAEVFKQAAEWMRTNRTLKLSTAQKLCAYGLFKQVSMGRVQCLVTMLNIHRLVRGLAAQISLGYST